MEARDCLHLISEVTGESTAATFDSLDGSPRSRGGATQGVNTRGGGASRASRQLGQTMKQPMNGGPHRHAEDCYKLRVSTLCLQVRPC